MIEKNWRTGLRKAFGLWQSPPDLTVSEWADEFRFLSQEDSAEPGKYYTSRAEYQRGIMDAFSDYETEEIVIMSSAQIGKTLILCNIIGFFVDLDPAPMLLVQPTDEMAQAFSKDRLAPMIRDTPAITKKIKEVKSKNSNNTILHKKFPGGHITIAGSNAPAKLASRPIRVVLLDEVDRYPLSSGTEGDPVNLARKRATTFYNRKIALVSTPGIQGQSRIEKAFEETDQRYFHVPCPKCKKTQLLRWHQVKWEKSENGEHLPETAYYQCGHCNAKWSDVDRQQAVKLGKWIAEKPFRKKAGFHLNALYSPWSSLEDIVSEHLESLKDTEQRKTWVNTVLGETWVEEGETIDEASLINRVEAYSAQVPKKGFVLTAGVDVQADRLEAEVVAWGKDNESWSVEYKVLYGDTTQKAVWNDLDDYLQSDFKHSTGVTLNISATCIDSGFNTNEVYEFCRRRASRRIWAIKGQGGSGTPIAGRASKVKYGKPVKTVNLFPIGVDQAKTLVYSNLKKTEPGPGYCHFPNTYTPEYFDGLTAEKAVIKYVKGFKKVEWKKIRERNEPLDCRVYAQTAVKLLSPNMDKIADRLLGQSIQAKIEAIRQKIQGKKQAQPKRPEKPRKKGGFVKAWRNR